MDAEQLRRRLTAIRDKTAGALSASACRWLGEDRSDERLVFDNALAGRLHWHEAHEHAKDGLAQLEADNLEAASESWLIAQDFYVKSLEMNGYVSRKTRKPGEPVKPPDFTDLATSAKPRGRKGDPKRPAVVAAVETAKARGLKGGQAIGAAKRAAPAAFQGKGQKRVQNIMAEARKRNPPGK